VTDVEHGVNSGWEFYPLSLRCEMQKLAKAD
jgi:hypothetical protein